MRRLDGTHYFSKVDLADAYNQIELGPESQRCLALSTHRGVLLQTRLPFGISSATGYFQDVMNQLTSDLPGVAVYLDNILISGKTAEDHLNNLRRLLKRLDDRGLRCRIQKCVFAQDSVTYLGHTISRDGISKRPKADAVTKMPAPSNVSQLRSFLGSVQFYNKFLPDLSTISEPLYHLTEKHTKWKWEEPQQDAFQKLKQMLTNNTVLAHFDPSCPVGISCDASESGVGAVLFHRYKDNSERPIANASKTLTDAQKRYPQIQKEALSIIFALKKYHQFLYGRPFILVTDHKPLSSMFGPNTATPMLAANRLARWSLMLSQYDYTIEYRSTKQHGNADALSRLPVGPDLSFGGEEGENDVDTVCTIRVINSQLQPHSRNQLKDATNRDPVLSEVKRYVREGWPQKIDSPDVQEHQAREATKSQQKEQTAVQHVRTAYDVGTPCYALYCGPRQTSTPRWVPATITRVHGTRTFTVKVHPRGPLWKRHLEQPKAETLSPPAEVKTSDQTVPEYGRHNPRRSSRQRKPRQLYDAQ